MIVQGAKMNPQAASAGENILHLQQALELIGRLTDEQFTQCPSAPFRGGVGSQFRHCIDFYGCFLAGLGSGRIDYGHRDRDPQTEKDRGHAAARIGSVIEALRGIDAGDLDRAVDVRSEEGSSGEAAWCRSSVHRELQFLSSHTVHHHALIVALLLAQGCSAGNDLRGFGVAPSTLAHWEKAGSGVA